MLDIPILDSAPLDSTVLGSTVLGSSLLDSSVLNNVVWSSALLGSTVRDSSVLDSTLRFSLYNTVLGSITLESPVLIACKLEVECGYTSSRLCLCCGYSHWLGASPVCPTVGHIHPVVRECVSHVGLIHAGVGAHAGQLADSFARMVPNAHIVVVRHGRLTKRVAREVVGIPPIDVAHGVVLLEKEASIQLVSYDDNIEMGTHNETSRSRAWLSDLLGSRRIGRMRRMTGRRIRRRIGGRRRRTGRRIGRRIGGVGLDRNSRLATLNKALVRLELQVGHHHMRLQHCVATPT